ncbi:MAG TPA: glycosyltransferase family 9 protein [Acetobacteraceae bacterium]|nr:glycosyltransferase family 9 protein [Acetobacteraceae bacterium]
MNARPHRLLVVQPLPGIGDMVWHLPHIRALARHAGGPVTLLAKPRSRADEILAAEDTVREIIWVDRNPKGATGAHDGVLGLWRLIRTLRAGRFDAAVLLHNSATLAFATLAAGIPLRQGYGIGVQRWFLNRGPHLTTALWRQNRPLQRASLFLTAANIAMDETEPRLAVAPAARLTVLRRLQDVARPFVVLGIGSSEQTRQWGAARFGALARALIDAGWPGLALVGGPGEEPQRREICAALAGDAARVVPALGWHLAETAALLAEAAFYVGNDTGMMNMAAAVGTRAYALFGTTPALRHSAHIVPVTAPPGGPIDGVARVSLEAVLAAIERDRGSLGQRENGRGACGRERRRGI